MQATAEMVEAGATALANASGARRGVPRISNVLSALPDTLAEQFRKDARDVLEATLPLIEPCTFTDKDGVRWRVYKADPLAIERIEP